MKRTGQTANTVSVTGGNHVGNVIGAGHVDNHAEVVTGGVGSDGDSPATVADLRGMLGSARNQILGAAATEEERVELAYELRKILEALDADVPKGQPVRERWLSVRSMLGTLASTGVITAITDVVTSLFGSD